MLFGTGGVGLTYEGSSIALSADSNTAIVGGDGDNSGIGAAWVFTRSGGTWTQQGSKLIGSGYVSCVSSSCFNIQQGYSVALSADGNTAVIGGPGDNADTGAAWVFTNNGGIWSQQGSKLVGTAAAEEGGFGTSVAISADGSTIAVGGPHDGYNAGSIPGEVWIFTQSGSAWTEQGSALFGTGNVGDSRQGTSLALSEDGNTLLVGGPDDNPYGAAWVFTRSGGTWTQQGAKLVGTGSVDDPAQGASVALSGDGNSAIVGGFDDNGGTGAAWVFSQSGGTWSQQSSKLVGTGGVGAGFQGFSVALSSDGNTALVGGYNDNGSTGAAWFFGQIGGTWSQRGLKLVGSSVTGVAAAKEAYSLAMSADGNTAVIGGPGDNAGAGAAWVFVKATPTDTHDFNDASYSDILWRDTSGDVAMWLMNGATVAQSSGVGNASPTVWSIVGQRDFNGDGKADILWHDTSGDVAIWFMNGPTITQSSGVGNAPTTWSIVGTGDFFGDGHGDILWRDTSGNVAIWEMNGATVMNSCSVGNADPNVWSIVGTGDFNGDGYWDILWRDTSGDVAIWFMNGCTIDQSVGLGTANPSVWSIAGIGDFDGDGTSDILWHDNSGDVAVWLVFGSTVWQSSYVGTASPSVWSIAQTGDYYGAGTSDILWRDTSGDVAVWQMNGATITQSAGIGTAPTVWSIQGAGAD